MEKKKKNFGKSQTQSGASYTLAFMNQIYSTCKVKMYMNVSKQTLNFSHVP